MTNGSDTVALDKKFIIPAFDTNSNKKLNVCRAQFINWCRRTLNLDKDRNLKTPEQQITFLKKYHKNLEPELIKCFIIDDINIIKQHKGLMPIDKIKSNLSVYDLVYENVWNKLMLNYPFFENKEERPLIPKERNHMWEEPEGTNLCMLHVFFNKAFVKEMRQLKNEENVQTSQKVESGNNIEEVSVKKEEITSIMTCLETFMKSNHMSNITIKAMFIRLKLYFKTSEIMTYFGITSKTMDKVMNDESISDTTFNKLSEKIKPIKLVK